MKCRAVPVDYFHSMIEKSPYDNIDPVVYQNRRYQDRQQKYLHEHWEPFTSALIAQYVKDAVVLDLGCGLGDRSFEMKKYAKKVLAIDSSKRMLDYARANYSGVEFIHADATDIPLQAHAVDVVFSIGLLEYVRPKEKLISEISRVLKPGGVAVIASTNLYSIPCFLIAIWYKIIGKQRMCSEPSFNQMTRIFCAAGFEMVNYKMDDGLFWLPFKLDILFGEKAYLLVEKFFNVFGRNPFSTVMVFIIKKAGS